MIINIDPYKNTFYYRQLPNNKYRYEGNFNTISYCIDSLKLFSQEEIFQYLESCSIDFLINNEGYIITLEV